MQDIAAALQVSIGLLLRRMRQAPRWRAHPAGELGTGPARPQRPGHPGRAGQGRTDQPAVDGRDARRTRGSAAWSGGSRIRRTAGGWSCRSPTPACELLRNRRSARTEQMAAGPVGRVHRPPNSGNWLRPHRCSSDWRRASDGGCRLARTGRRPLQVGRAVEHDRRRLHVRARRVDRHHRAARHLPRHPSRSAGARQRLLPAVDDHGIPAGAGRARGHPRPPRRHVRPGQDLQRGLRGVHRRLDPAVVRSRSSAATARSG